MLPDQLILCIPGPTQIPPSVQRAMSQPTIGHREKETSTMIQQMGPKLKAIFGTKQIYIQQGVLI